MYKEVNASLFTSNYHPPALDRRPPPQIHGDVSRKFEGLNVGSTFGNVGPTFRGGRRNFEDLDTELGRNFGEPSTGGQRGTFGEGNTGAHAMPAGMFDAEQGRRNFGEPSTGGARRNFGERDSGGNAGAYKMSGGLSFPAASDPQSISFGSSSNLIDPQPFQPQAFQPSPSLEPEHAERKSSIPKVLATHPVSNGAANSSSPSHSTNMVAFFLVKADLNSVPPSQRASLPYRTEAALVSGNDPPPSAWVHPELARSLARSRVKADSGFVQTLEDGTQVSVPDEHTYAVGTNQSHRLIRTRLRWPVPITKTEENVLVDGVRAYVRQHQTLPASISELLAYCD